MLILHISFYAKKGSPQGAPLRCKFKFLLIQKRRADDACVVAESAGAEDSLLVVVLGVALLLDDLSQRTEKVLALVGDTAADAEYVGLEDVDASNAVLPFTLLMSPSASLSI